MKNIILCAVVVGLSLGLSHAEIVTNSKGEQVELNKDGTWEKVSAEKKTDDGKILKGGDSVLINVKDGGDNRVSIKINVVDKGDTGRTIEFWRLESWTDFVGSSAKRKLKNKYSFVPKNAIAIFENNTLTISMEYVAENSYGANVVGRDFQQFIIENDGALKLIR